MDEIFEPLVDDLALLNRVQQFYYREARLLDERKAQQWLGLLAEDIQYLVPSRHIAMADPSLRGTEAYHDPANELEYNGPDECPFREENIFNLAIRVDRLYKVNAWAENPPARTRRFISNIELSRQGCKEGEIKVWSNFQLFYSRHHQDNYTYTGQRRDLLREVESGFQIASREVIFDWNVLEVPSLGLLF